jgi:hypothetical protein
MSDFWQWPPLYIWLALSLILTWLMQSPEYGPADRIANDVVWTLIAGVMTLCLVWLVANLGPIWLANLL